MVFRRLQHAHVAVPVGLNGSGGFVLMKNNFPDSLTKKFGGMFALHHENIDFRINFEENLMVWYQIWSFGGYSITMKACQPVLTTQKAPYR